MNSNMTSNYSLSDTVKIDLVQKSKRIASSSENFEKKVLAGKFDNDLRKAFIVDRVIKLLTTVVEFDSEACDKGVPPSVPSQRLLDDLSELNLEQFNNAISSAQLEFIGVFDYDNPNKMIYMGYATREKGAVSIPTNVLSDDTKRFIVTHNHPNTAAFSAADFSVFCQFDSIKTLYACSVPTTYKFNRIDPNFTIDEALQNEVLRNVESEIAKLLELELQIEANYNLRSAKKRNALNRFFSCEKEGAKIWSDITDRAWNYAFDLMGVRRQFEKRTIQYTSDVNRKDAEGEFGTADVDDLINIVRDAKKLTSRGFSGLGDDSQSVIPVSDETEQDSRHKAPYRDEEGFFSPAYDVSKSFPGIYTMSFAKALNEYGTGSESDPESLQIIRNIQNDPEAKVKIYRAVEKGLQDNISDLKQDRKYINRNGSVPPWTDVPPHSADEYSEFVDSQIENLGSVEGASIQATINPKDWVAISRQYAIDYGESSIPNGYTILTKTVKAKELFTEGNSINEWGYDPTLDDSNLSGDGFVPPESVQKEAERGLEWRREFNRGGTEVGVARARDLSNGRSVSLDTVKRMKAYFDRHQVDKNAEGFRLGEDGYPTAGRIAWALWGGDAGYNWAKSIVAKNSDGLSDHAASLDGKILNVQENEQQKETAPFTTQDVVNMPAPESLPLQGELKEFLTNLLAKFNMLIWGGAGSGKSSFVLRLANELAETNTGRVLYFMTEEKVSSGRLKARMDLMKAYSENVNFDDQGTIDRLTALVNTGMYRYVIVDSINMINAEQKTIVELMQTFPEVSWVFIAQATKGKNAYAGIQSLAHGVDTEIATTNEKGTATAELRKHRDGPLKTHTIFGNSGMRDPKWKATW